MKSTKIEKEETATFSIRVPRNLILELQKIANKKGVSRTRVIIDAMKDYLEKQQK